MVEGLADLQVMDRMVMTEVRREPEPVVVGGLQATALLDTKVAMAVSPEAAEVAVEQGQALAELEELAGMERLGYGPTSNLPPDHRIVRSLIRVSLIRRDSRILLREHELRKHEHNRTVWSRHRDVWDLRLGIRCE